MLQEYLIRDEVIRLLDEIKNNGRYFKKENNLILNHSFNVSYEVALYLFYDAIYLFKVIVDDAYLFNEYLEQIEKLYRKLDNFSDIRLGIHKLIGRMVMVKISQDDSSEDGKKKIISYIYDKYIKCGYYIHGFSTVYEEDIIRDGFRPEVYRNYYDRFQQVNDIFTKNHAPSVISKDFSSKNVVFTDDFIMGCYYSVFSPNYFYEFLTQSRFERRARTDHYLIGNYDALISHLKRFMSNSLFHDDDMKNVLKLVEDEKNLLNSKNKRISLLLVRRDKISSINNSFYDYYSKDEDIYEMIDGMLSSKQGNIVCNNYLSVDDFEIVSLDFSYNNLKEIEKDEEEKVMNKEVMDTYGSVSILLLLGSLFIVLGVIITIIIVIRG